MTLDDIIALYGDPHAPDFEARCIVPFDLPYALIYGTAMVWRSRAHRLCVPAFQAVFQQIKDAGLTDRAASYGGIYACRPIRGFPKFTSAHAWGAAIDLNPAENLLGSVGHQDPRVVTIFKANGFASGADFKARLDPMHFTLLGF